MARFALIVLAGPQEGARAFHGLLYADDLHTAGHEVRLVFDGAGTTWVKAFTAPDARHCKVFDRVRAAGLIAGVCAFCANAFGVADAVAACSLHLQGDAGGHPSIARLVADGYSPLVV